MHYNQPKYEEEKLISLLAQDSEYAFQLLYDRYRNRIYHTAVRYLKSPLLAQEVVQDVFMKLWFERKKLKPNQPIEAWLHIIAKNNLINRLKKIANEWKALNGLRFVMEHSVDRTENKVQENQYNQLLLRAISELPEQQQKVFQLARHEQLTYVQISERLGISPLTVKTHMSRAIGYIKTYFSNYGEIFFFFLLFNLFL